MNQLAQWIGYAFMIIGGLSLAVLVILYLVTAALNTPMIRPKVLKIIRLGSQAWLDERRKRRERTK